MRLVVEQGFVPQGARGQTVFQVWHQEDGLFLLREVPYDTIGIEQLFPSMVEAVAQMKSLMVRRGYRAKNDGARARHLPPNATKAQPAFEPLSRFDRDDII